MKDVCQKNKFIVIYSIVLLLTFLFQPCYSQIDNVSMTKNKALQVASLFKNHMVLQRDMLVPVWGKATVGATIFVEFGGSKKQTIVGPNGKWRLQLDKQKTSFESKKMTVSSSLDSNKIEISDVLIGDVWICSGQSNMQFSINGAPEVKKIVPLAKNIRSFTVKNTVAFEPQDTCEGNWKVQPPNSAVAFSFAYFLEKSENVPVGIILAAWGSSSIEAWMPKEMIETVPHFKIMMEEFDANDIAKEKIQTILDGPKPWSKNDDIFLRRQTNVLYNAMMYPLIPYACKGVVWYQGERNTKSMNGMVNEPWYARNSGMLKYGNVLKEWVKQYRRNWDNNEMHFLVVMLPGYGKVLKTDKNIDPNSPNAHSWAWMREAQLKIQELPHTSVANTIDLGDYKNIHPKDKLPIGERLSLLVNKDVFNKKIIAHGPTLKKVKVKKNKIIIAFNDARELKTIDGENPSGFWLANNSGNWYPAEAKIKSGKVVLTSSSVENPLYVRYAFTGKPNVNLVNEANLPTYPFRTDSFIP